MMNQDEKTRDFLIKHCEKYPALKIQDMFKFLYQSSFGAEHMITSLQAVTERIEKEWESGKLKSEIFTEPLDGEYSRVHLGFLNAKTLGKLFYMSAKREENGFVNLERKLCQTEDLIKNGELPFSLDEFIEARNEWKSSGYPAVRHSDVFRETYKPSYRVIANKYVPFLLLFSKLDEMLLKGRVILSVEGASASGKTTLGKMLEELYDCTVFHMDDFFLRPEQRTTERLNEVGGNVDRERFLNEVLIPLKENKTINYQRFDCSTGELLPPVSVIPKILTVVEGAYSMHTEMEEYYDFSVFLEIDEETQKKRILNRNGKEMAERFFNEWIPLEKKYFDGMNVKNRCDMTVSVFDLKA